MSENFEDPHLKSVVQRCWASDCAPSELRRRVQGLLQEHQADQTSRSRFLLIPRSSWILAAAALVVLVIGLSLRFSGLANSGGATPVIASATPQLPLEIGLIFRHEECCKHVNHHHIAAPKDNDTAIAAALQANLSRAVLVARPSTPGWDFRGAAICPIGAVPAGHLVFARGDDTLSIFSLPKTVDPALKAGQLFTASLDGHDIVGFEKNDSVFFLVSASPSGAMTINDLQKMQSQMAASVTLAQSARPEPVALAELLRAR